MLQADAVPTTTAITVADIDTTVNCEPRVLDTKLGTHLGMARPTNIRSQIEANRTELESFGSLHAARAMIEAGKGAKREVVSYYLTEGQALCVCALSRAPNAPHVRRSLIEAFMELRRQKLGAPAISWRAPSITAGERVPVKAHSRGLPQPVTMKNGCGAVMLDGQVVAFDGNRTPRVGDSILVVWRSRRMSVETFLEQHPDVIEARTPGPGFIWVLKPERLLGTYHCREKVALIGVVTAGAKAKRIAH